MTLPTPTPPPRAESPAGFGPSTLPACVVGPGGRFHGLFAFDGAARLEGELEGQVVARGTLWVGESARLRASIRVDELVVAGAVEGEIHARARVELLPTARVEGTIHTGRLTVAEGARFEGRLEMEAVASRPG